MQVVVVDWLSVKETVADELKKQLRIEENHDCSWQLEKLRQTELMIVVAVIYWLSSMKQIVNVVVVVEKNNGNVGAVVVVELNSETLVVVVVEGKK